MMHLRLCCLVAVTAVALPSQATHLVGPGGLRQIRDALAVASPGDVIHVQPGTYAHFTATVPVTIRALVPRSVTVVFDPTYDLPGCPNPFLCASLYGPTRLGPPAGQTLNVVGVDFASTVVPTSFGSIYHRLVVTGGRVTLDDCSVQVTDAPALTVQGATLHLQRCLVVSQAFSMGASGMVGTGATITASQCEFRGGSPLYGIGGGGFPKPGIQLLGCLLLGSGLTVQGGSQGFGNLGAPAAELSADSRVWLSDSVLVAGKNSCAVSAVPLVSQFSRCTLVNTTPGCQAPPAGGFLLGVERPDALKPGARFTLRYRTEPNGVVIVFAGADLDTVDFGPLLVQPSWLAESTSFLVDILLADAQGSAVASWAIPPSAFADQSLWFKGLSGWTLPLQVSPIVGGIMR